MYSAFLLEDHPASFFFFRGNRFLFRASAWPAEGAFSESWRESQQSLRDRLFTLPRGSRGLIVPVRLVQVVRPLCAFPEEEPKPMTEANGRS